MIGTIIKVVSIPVVTGFALYRGCIWHRANVLNNPKNKHFIVSKMTGQRVLPSKHVYIQPWISDNVGQIRTVAQEFPQWNNDSIYEIQYDFYEMFPFARMKREDTVTGCLWVWDESNQYFGILEEAEKSRVFRNSKEGISCDDWNS